MVTLKCKLLFRDGAELSAQVEAESPEGDYVVSYNGAVDRIEHRFAMSDVAFLEHWFRTLANKLDARLEVERTGEFESYAE